MTNNFSIFEISPEYLNLFSFMLGMTFASFLSWYRRTSFIYVVGYFMSLAFYYGAIKPNIDTPQHINTSSNSIDYKPLPLPTKKSP